LIQRLAGYRVRRFWFIYKFILQASMVSTDQNSFLFTITI
jgi:hypothetical protein